MSWVVETEEKRFLILISELHSLEFRLFKKIITFLCMYYYMEIEVGITMNLDRYMCVNFYDKQRA
jgi:hypothetical protein